MPQNPLKVLGINPGTRYLGIAYFYGDDLLDWVQTEESQSNGHYFSID